MTLNNKHIIGITGGIATGKSTVSRLLLEKGYRVIDADKIARQVVENGMPAYKAIVEEFGQSVLEENGDLDRKALGAIVFADEKLLKVLNNIMHGYIFEKINYLIGELLDDVDLVFLDIPLLFEVREELEEEGIICDEIWLIYANRQTQIDRLILRDGISSENAISRINAQMDIEEKKLLASGILHNSGTVEELEEQLDRLLKKV